MNADKPPVFNPRSSALIGGHLEEFFNMLLETPVG